MSPSRSELTLASREHLDNLTMVVNCNLQRLDGPVRGNTKIVQELAARFTGAGWNVIKCLGAVHGTRSLRRTAPVLWRPASRPSPTATSSG